MLSRYGIALARQVMYAGVAWNGMTRAYVAGIAPRSQTYMRRHWDHAKAFIADEDLEAARRQEEQRWQALQKGLDLLSPAYVATEDILRPLTRLPGAEAGPLTRTFETNTFHRQPVFSSTVPVDGLRAWVDSVRLAGAWALSLPSPYDASLRSEGWSDSVAECLADAAAYALRRGARLVRFQEPTAAYRRHDPDVERFARLIATVTDGIEDRCVVHFNQGDVLSRPALVQAVPCDIGVDAASLQADLDLSGRRLHVGIVRGESSLVEDLAPAAEALARRTGAELAAVTNGWDLEHVPFDVAAQKIQILAKRIVEVAA